MRLIPFQPQKKQLLEGCPDVDAYFSKNKHIYQNLYPSKPEAELQRIALYDWNEMVPEEKIATGAFTAEKRIVDEIADLEEVSFFHKDAPVILDHLQKNISKHISNIKCFRVKGERSAKAKGDFKLAVQKAIDIVQPSMDALHKAELSEQEHLDELYTLMQNDRFLKRLINNVDKKILSRTTIFDIEKKLQLSPEKGIPELGRKFVGLIEETRQSLERQNFALHEMLIELNKEKPSLRIIKRNCSIFKKELPALKKQALFFSKLDKTAAELASQIEKIRTGTEQAGFEYLNSSVGLPDLASESVDIMKNVK